MEHGSAEQFSAAASQPPGEFLDARREKGGVR